MVEFFLSRKDMHIGVKNKQKQTVKHIHIQSILFNALQINQIIKITTNATSNDTMTQ